MSVQGEFIRDVDGGNNLNKQHGHKTNLGDSDDEDQSTQANANEHSTMDVYRLRQQKRVKLSTTADQ